MLRTLSFVMLLASVVLAFAFTAVAQTPDATQAAIDAELKRKQLYEARDAANKAELAAQLSAAELAQQNGRLQALKTASDNSVVSIGVQK